MAKNPEIRVTVSKELKEKLRARYEAVGASESDYVRSLLIEDLKNG
jgi:hypothetical protein